jgi:hypothetical protein
VSAVAAAALVDHRLDLVAARAAVPARAALGGDLVDGARAGVDRRADSRLGYDATHADVHEHLSAGRRDNNALRPKGLEEGDETLPMLRLVFNTSSVEG